MPHAIDMRGPPKGGAAALTFTPEATESVLIVNDEPSTAELIQRSVAPVCVHTEIAADANAARALARRIRFDLLITDIRPSGATSGPVLARELRELWQINLDVIFITDCGDVFDEMDAFRDTTAEVLRKPFHAAQVLALVKRLQDRRRAAREQFLMQREQELRPVAKRIVGESQAIKDIWQTIHRIAPMPTTVLIKGETGTGKELVARALHDLSGRRGSYVPVNCGAISADLIEGELFGHLKGAFTGAHQSRNGLFSHADGGTLFLDEIGEMPLALQAKLLRVLEERRFRPVGSSQEIPVNARVIAATNRDLAAEVLAGRFRKDLYYRINVVDIRLPALRERKSDLPHLATYFMNLLSTELGVPPQELNQWDLQELASYDWPGNCRELRNVIERSLLLGQPISHYLRSWRGEFTSHSAAIAIPEPDSPPPVGAPPRVLSKEFSSAPTLESMERSHILSALALAGGNKTLAARKLGVSRKTIERKIKKWSSEEPHTDH